jgi:hypothetical protein
MKYLKSYKIFENLDYTEEWKKWNSSIRTELEDDIDDILLGLHDRGYKTMISGWTSSSKSPYIWIKRGRVGQTSMSEETRETVERLKDYLSASGFWNRVEVINQNRQDMQIYLHFDRKNL